MIDELFAISILKPYPRAPEEAKFFLAELFFKTREGSLCVEVDTFPPLPEDLFGTILMKEGNRIYLKRNWESEHLFLKEIERIKNHEVKELQNPLLDNKLLPKQRRAIEFALKFPLTLICGGPGTGKSYLASELMRLFFEGNFKVIALAPTGKAAQNLRGNLKEIGEKITIQTIHQALAKTRFLPFDLLVVDEASMIDAALFARFLEAVKIGARVVILGDPYQLPPVEAGHLFSDLLQKEKKFKVELETILRTEKRDLIELSLKIKEGREFPFLPLPDPKELISQLKEKMDFSSFEAFQNFKALSPLKFGPYGVMTLNQKLYQELKDKTPFIPIMITKNEKELALFNGDMGYLQGDKGYFQNKVIPLPLLPPFELAYLNSIHKSQGSEFNEVMVILPKGAENFGKEMIYTAVTRAKEKVSLYGDKETIDLMRVKKTFRHSGLK